MRITTAGEVDVGVVAVAVRVVEDGVVRVVEDGVVVVVEDEDGVVAVGVVVVVVEVVPVIDGVVAVCVLVAGGDGVAVIVTGAVILVAGLVTGDVRVLAGAVAVGWVLVELALKTVDVLLHAARERAETKAAALSTRVREDRIRSFSYPRQIKARAAQEEPVKPVLTGQLWME